VSDQRESVTINGRLFYRRVSPPHHISDENGLVALRYHQPANVLALQRYVFVPQNKISLAWVHPAHVGQLLQKRVGCCGNLKLGFFAVSEDELGRWLNGA
jgi:hypothetical protein